MNDTLYSIKEQTLVDIGDALRRRHGETETVEAEIPMIKASASTDSTGFGQYGGSFNRGYFCDVVTLSGAVSLKVKVGACLSLQKYVDANNGAGLWIAAGEYTVDTFPRTDDVALHNTETNTISSELEFSNTNVVSFLFADQGIGSERGYYAEITGYDANGELITEAGEIEIPRVYTSSEMAQAIDDLPAAPPEEAFVISGDCQYRFTYGGWDWFVDMYADKMTTNGITAASNMFHNSDLKTIPFEINFANTSSASLNYMFNHCKNLTSIPKLNNCKPSELSYIFGHCYKLRYLPEDIADWFDWSYMEGLTSSYSGNQSAMFSNCHSLRSIPVSFLNHGNRVITPSYTYFSNGFQNCYALDELVDLPIPYTGTWTSNVFSAAFNGCNRLKNFTFAVPDGEPYVKNWKSQTIDLSTGYVGYASYGPSIINNNSGITADKEVKDDASYQALKDDPDWFTCKAEYSRYNHDSAVATINSLPDTSAYGTNTIKFKGTAGSATDGGAINTLTEEEIAVAAARGWTVTFV